MIKTISTLLITLLTFTAHGQISESWNIDIDSYTHNSSNYSTKKPPIEIAEISNGDIVVLSQNGSLTRLTNNGKVVWRKEIKSCAQQRIVVDSNGHIIFSCEAQITKFDGNGNIVWERDYSDVFSKRNLTFDAITTNENKIYIVGHFFHSKAICQLALDKNGDIVWKTRFKQKVAYEYSFLPPKQLLIVDQIIYVLAHHYTQSNSFLYVSNIMGKKRKEKAIRFKIKKLKSTNNELFALGHLNSLQDQLIFCKIGKDLELTHISECQLPRNIDYEKAIRSWATQPPTKAEFQKEYITSYDINDFEFIDNDKLMVIGNSYGKPWIANWNINKGLSWNWDKADKRYFKFNNKYTFHQYRLSTIIKIGQDYIISGISSEEDNQEDLFVIYLNLFVRRMTIN